MTVMSTFEIPRAKHPADVMRILDRRLVSDLKRSFANFEVRSSGLEKEERDAVLFLALKIVLRKGWREGAKIVIEGNSESNEMAIEVKNESLLDFLTKAAMVFSVVVGIAAGVILHVYLNLPLGAVVAMMLLLAFAAGGGVAGAAAGWMVRSTIRMMFLGKEIREKNNTLFAKFHDIAMSTAADCVKNCEDDDQATAANNAGMMERDAVLIRRTWTITVLSLLGLSASGFALAASIFMSARLIVVDGIWLDVVYGCAGAGIALPLASVLLNLMTGFTENARMGVVGLSTIAAGALFGYLAYLSCVIPFAAAGLLLASAVFYYERGLTIQLRKDGVARVLAGPFGFEALIPWEGLEAIEKNTFVMRGQTNAGVTAERQGTLAVTGRGRRIAVNAMRFEATSEFEEKLHELAAPHVIRRTICRIGIIGGVRFGPLRLSKEGLEAAPEGGSVPYEEITGSSLESGLLVIETKRGIFQAEASKTPNAHLIGLICETLARDGFSCVDGLTEEQRDEILGLEAENRGDFKRAVAVFEEALRKNPGSRDAPAHLGRLRSETIAQRVIVAALIVATVSMIALFAFLL